MLTPLITFADVLEEICHSEEHVIPVHLKGWSAAIVTLGQTADAEPYDRDKHTCTVGLLYYRILFDHKQGSWVYRFFYLFAGALEWQPYCLGSNLLCHSLISVLMLFAIF